MPLLFSAAAFGFPNRVGSYRESQRLLNCDDIRRVKLGGVEPGLGKTAMFQKLAELEAALVASVVSRFS